MATLSSTDRDFLHSLMWYMTARKAALRAALSFRTPLSVSDQTDLRVHYSGYFLNLLAAVDLIRDVMTLHANDFDQGLTTRLVFDGFPDGKNNYSYLRELRNAVIHRGLDITSSAHMLEEFPVILAISTVRHRSKALTYNTFDKYLLGLIVKCEMVVGPVMLEFLTASGLLDAEIDAEALLIEMREAVAQSHAIPDVIKAMDPLSGCTPQMCVDAHNSAIAALRDVLTPFDFSQVLA